MDNLNFDRLTTNSRLIPLENKLRRWAQPPSESEIEKCDRAVRMIKKAIGQDQILSQKDITVFSKGSFKNRTNIPSDSDVDVGVRLNSMFINDYPEGTTAGDFDFSNSDYSFEDFRQAVVDTIQNHFGYYLVEIGNKSIKIRSNTCRVNADVVPLCIHRRYLRQYNKNNYYEGVALRTAQSIIIKNWPQQNYDNGVKKNDETNRKFKGLVRIIKSLRNEMKENGYTETNSLSSFLVECLVWNVPNYLFKETYWETTTSALYFLYTELSKNISNDWGEINELKYLFRSSQKWTKEQACQLSYNMYSYLTNV